MVSCKLCGCSWKPSDIRMPGPCPKCQEERQYIKERCTGCRFAKLEQRMQSPAGKLLSYVADLDSMLQCPGFSVTPKDIDAQVWAALKILWSERVKYEEEQAKEAQMQTSAGEGRPIGRR